MRSFHKEQRQPPNKITIRPHKGDRCFFCQCETKDGWDMIGLRVCDDEGHAILCPSCQTDLPKEHAIRLRAYATIYQQISDALKPLQAIEATENKQKKIMHQLQEIAGTAEGQIEKLNHLVDLLAATPNWEKAPPHWEDDEIVPY